MRIIKRGELEMLAPHVDAGWRADLVAALEGQGAGGATISDVLAEVETHCRESGTSAGEAFGPAAAYARALDLPDESARRRGRVLRTGATLLLMLAGLSAIVGGVPALRRGQRVTVDAGTLVGLGAVAVMIVVVLALLEQVLGLAANHPAWALLGFTVLLVVVPLVGLPLGDVALGSVAAGPTVVVGVVAFAASCVWMIRAVRGDMDRDGPLARPGLPPDASDQR